MCKGLPWTNWTVNDFDIYYLMAPTLAIVVALLIAAASFVYLRLYQRSEAALS